MKKIVLKIFVLIIFLLTIVINCQCFAVTSVNDDRAKELLNEFDNIEAEEYIDLDDNIYIDKSNNTSSKVTMPAPVDIESRKNSRISETVEKTLNSIRVFGILAIFMMSKVGKLFI